MARRGKYEPLREHLGAQRAAVLKMTFERIEALVGALPPSASKYVAWWANERNEGTAHVQCKAWLDAEYKARPNLKARTVTFEHD